MRRMGHGVSPALLECSWDPGRGHSCPLIHGLSCPLSCMRAVLSPGAALSPWPPGSPVPKLSLSQPRVTIPLGHLPGALPCHCPSCPGLQQ